MSSLIRYGGAGGEVCGFVYANGDYRLRRNGSMGGVARSVIQVVGSDHSPPDSHS